MTTFTQEQIEALGDVWEANTCEEFDAVVALVEALGYDRGLEILSKFSHPNDVAECRADRLGGEW